MRARSLLAGFVAFAFSWTVAPLAQASPGIEPGSFHATALNANGTVDTLAGSHPYQFIATFRLNSDVNENVEGSARDVIVGLPAGFVGNPTAVPRCTSKDFDGQVANCPPDTQIGTFLAKIRGAHEAAISPKGAVYNLVPPKGVAASFGFAAESFTVIENAHLIRGGAGGYRVSVVVNNVSHEHLLEATQTVWGVPADSRHDGERECIVEAEGEKSHVSPCSIEAARVPFLTLPSSCAPQLPTTLEVDFLEAIGSYFEQSSESPQLVGCEGLDFRPSITLAPQTSAAATATGLDVDLHMPQGASPEGLAEADLRDAQVVLPEGVAVNPSAANGLQSCSSAHIALESTAEPSCPAASQIGTVEVDTPLIDHPLPGTIYLAAQNDNPFHSLLALYIVVDDPATGVIVKLAGHVEANPVTGQLTTTFTENPQFPFEDFKLDFTDGPHAPLMTPSTCGSFATTATLTPWTAPEGPPVTRSSAFQISSGPGGSPCVSSPALEPNQPHVEAGTTAPVAAAYSPFVLAISRADGSQAIRTVETVLPPGLTGKLAGVPRCSDPQIAQAQSPGRTGAQELAAPSCPAATKVGTAVVSAGAGANPVTVTGQVYLAGPYNGGPFSLAIITPALAGPFDLGTVVVRSALYIDPTTAQVTVFSDPIPTILQGIPLDVRSIVVSVDRPQFTLNPTSCEHMSLGIALTSDLGQSASFSSPFQVGGCSGLPFKPSFSLSTSAKTSRLDGASLTAKVAASPGEANIHKVLLTLPAALPSRLSTIQKACSEAQFAAAPNAAACPEGSLVGSARAVTPLLGVPLEGPGYLVSHGGAAFPDLVFLLSGEGIRIQLVGHTDIKKGITYSRFEAVPDQPISSFEALFPEGPHSALGAVEDLCAKRLTAPTTLVGQNGAQLVQNTVVSVTGCPKPTIRIGKGKVSRHALLLGVTVSQPSRVVFSGRGLRTTKLALEAGRQRVRIQLLHGSHPASTRLHVSVKGIGGVVARSATLRL